LQQSFGACGPKKTTKGPAIVCSFMLFAFFQILNSKGLQVQTAGAKEDPGAGRGGEAGGRWLAQAGNQASGKVPCFFFSFCVMCLPQSWVRSVRGAGGSGAGRAEQARGGQVGGRRAGGARQKGRGTRGQKGAVGGGEGGGQEQASRIGQGGGRGETGREEEGRGGAKGGVFFFQILFHILLPHHFQAFSFSFSSFFFSKESS